MKPFLIYFFLFTSTLCFSQAVPTPGHKQEQAIAILHATIHIGNGTVLENGTILFTNGTITAIGEQVLLPENCKQIDATGKHIYPGLIAIDTIIGLSEIEALRQTRDFKEVGHFNPNVRSIIAYNTDSRVTPTIRSNGILIAQIAPQGGLVSGTSSVVNLDAWNWEDAVVNEDDALFVNWPKSVQNTGWWAEPGELKKNKAYQTSIQQLTAFFNEAQSYFLEPSKQKNLRFEGMKGIFNGKKRLFIRVDAAKDMISAVSFAKQYGIKPVLLGASEAHIILDFLKNADVDIVLDSVHRLPSFQDESVNLPYQLPNILHNAGISFAMTYTDFWQVRNLPFLAGTAAAHGLDKELALQSITLQSAKILNIDQHLGSLEIGKDATLIISEGDVLDMATSNVIDAYIFGRRMNIGNKQKDLYKKFGTKLGQDIDLPTIQE